MELIPLGDRILVQPNAPPAQTESGLYLSEHRKPETSGVVMRVPTRTPHDCPECGQRSFRTVDVQVGDTVVFSWQAGLEVFIDESRYLLISEADIAAVVQEEFAHV